MTLDRAIDSKLLEADTEPMQLSNHYFYRRLDVWEEELCERLIGSDLAREQLPFRVDSKIFTAVIVAAECNVGSGAILVVADDKFADSWVTAWERAGQREARRGKTRTHGPEVIVVTPEDLKRNQRSFDKLIYSVIIVAGCVSHADASFVADTFSFRQAWRMIPQPEQAAQDWPLGVAGRALYLDNDAPYACVTFRPVVRSRPSGLAERRAA